MKAFALDSALAGKRFVVFKDPRRDDLSFLTPEKWGDFLEKLKQLPNSEKINRWFKRALIGSAYIVEIDKNGVAWIPDYLSELVDTDQ